MKNFRPAQCGGRFDAIGIVLALVLLVQLRVYQGLPTFPTFLDQQWAFDVADHDAMRCSAYEVGVVGVECLLLDDMFSMDWQFAVVLGIASCLFRLRAGTAQGRRHSMAVFGGMLAWLRDAIREVTSWRELGPPRLQAPS